MLNTSQGGEQSFRYDFILVLIPYLLIPTLLSPSVFAQDYFRVSALELNDIEQSVIDLGVFSTTDGQLPGQYQVAIILNNQERDVRQIDFIQLPNKKLSPQLTIDDLKQLGINFSVFPALKTLSSEDVINDIGEYIPQASITFDFYRQRLEISIPQAALDNQARDSVAHHLWQQGQSALLMSYDFSGSDNHHDHERNQSYFLNLRSGINIGPWRLRNQSVYNYDAGHNKDGNNFSTLGSYIQRDIHQLKSQMMVGETFTAGNIFESVQFTGASITSEGLMLPGSQRGFAPIIRGIAQSNARVTVRQNNYIIHESYVPPGPFIITDLYATSGSGDLDVTINEKNGQQRKFVQPFSSVPIMQRAGQLRYQLIFGRYRHASIEVYKPYFSEAEFIYGLSNQLSLLSGMQIADNYKSLNGGIGLGMGAFGAFSLDMTLAETQFRHHGHKQGQSYRIQYAKSIAATGTALTLAGYRYSTSGYYSFNEANEWIGKKETRHGTNKRHRLQLSLNQGMGDFGRLYLSAYQQDYWGEQGASQSLSAGYHISYGGIGYGLNLAYSNSKESIRRKDRQASFNVSIPLDKWLPGGWATYSINKNDHGQGSQQFAINGSALSGGVLSYGITGSQNNYQGGSSAGASLGYTHSSGRMNIGYSNSDHRRSLNYGLSGGMVAHHDGITFSQPLGETVVLVKAAGTADTEIVNHSGIKTDSRGYAVIPSVEPYTYNRIALHTEALADNVDIDDAVKNVVPTRGAVISADFRVRHGYRVLATLRYHGKSVPFGAKVALTNSHSSGIVGDNGELYLSGVSEKATINVQWGKGKGQQCYVNTDLSAFSKKSGVLQIAENCHD
ncbi:fimbria/pilus outer membrane usher protein [Yersinia ruckeri]|uniref:fimbria/pilus outer membrane usher protein n=1 Tax=Yersinia ruckeri TaxID=29486 RepID=UPI0021127605|nr:fimbria/pilus outer membrane usher protein [Yersinia ruckeri]